MERERLRVETLACTSNSVADMEKRLEVEGFMYSIDKEGKALVGIKHFPTKALVASSLSIESSFDPAGRPINCRVTVEVTGP